MTESVNELVQKLSRNKGISPEETALRLYEKAVRGEVRLIDPDPPKDFFKYLGSLYSVWFWLVIISLVAMWLTIYVFPQTPPFSWLRVGLGFLTSLYLPGYVFIEALYPQKRELEELERFALSIGLSIALTPLVGFVLNYTPWGIRLYPITIGISLITFFLGLFGVYRKYTYHLLYLELRNEA